MADDGFSGKRKLNTRWIVVLAIAVFVAITGVATDATVTAARRDSVAVAAVSREMPAQWTIRHVAFSLWASDVRSSGFRFIGGAGPAWVIELAAPGDSRWQRYSGFVVVDAVTGDVHAASASGLNDGHTPAS